MRYSSSYHLRVKHIYTKIKANWQRFYLTQLYLFQLYLFRPLSYHFYSLSSRFSVVFNCIRARLYFVLRPHVFHSSGVSYSFLARFLIVAFPRSFVSILADCTRSFLSTFSLRPPPPPPSIIFFFSFVFWASLWNEVENYLIILSNRNVARATKKAEWKSAFTLPIFIYPYPGFYKLLPSLPIKFSAHF